MRLPAALIVLLGVASAAAAQRTVASHPIAAPARPAAHEVARVNSVPIMSDRLDAAVNALIPLESFHRTVKPDKLQAMRDKALQRLIDEELQYQDGVHRGVKPTASELNAGVAEARRRFGSPQAFEQALRRSGMSLADVRREIRRSLIIKKTHDRVVTSQCQVSGAEAARFFAAQPERFVVPEQLHIYAITIGVDPSSSAKQWGDARARADEILRQLRGGAAFQDLARKYSTDPSRDKGGDMGFVHRGGLNDEFEKATRDLKPGQVSGVVQTIFGYHIVRVAEILPPQKKAFAEVSAGIQKDLTAKRCAEMADAWSARLRAGVTIVVAGAQAAPGIASAQPRRQMP